MYVIVNKGSHLKSGLGTPRGQKIQRPPTLTSTEEQVHHPGGGGRAEQHGPRGKKTKKKQHKYDKLKMSANGATGLSTLKLITETTYFIFHVLDIY